MKQSPRLLASCWTLAGDVVPLAGSMVSPRDFRARAEAAGKAGYVGMVLYVDDLVQIREQYDDEQIRQILTDNGLRYLELEVLMDWFADGERRAASDRTRRLLLDAAQRLGAHHIKVVGDMTGAEWPQQRMAESFRELCREAFEVGVEVVIEIMPTSNIRDLPTAIAIAAAAEEGNGGLLLDIWHFARGGIPFEDIASIPSRLIKHIELDDADREQIGTLLEDQILRRRLPGEGALDVPRFLRCVQATGYDGLYGIEIVSDAQRALPLEQAARLPVEATLRQFDLVHAGR
ncbi:Xylose isomerase-like TIM barrel [compost metagenome]